MGADCFTTLSQEARVQRLELDETSGSRHTFAVVSCNTGGRSFAFKPINLGSGLHHWRATAGGDVARRYIWLTGRYRCFTILSL
jgi:hypothetical protein